MALYSNNPLHVCRSVVFGNRNVILADPFDFEVEKSMHLFSGLCDTQLIELFDGKIAKGHRLPLLDLLYDRMALYSNNPPHVCRFVIFGNRNVILADPFDFEIEKSM